MPELRAGSAGTSVEPAVVDSDHARFYLFDAVTTFLRDAARDSPLLLVLDDVHWADEPSLLLLQFIARELRGARILTVATYRSTELDDRSDLLAELATNARHIVLSPFDRDDVASLVEKMRGTRPSPAVASAVLEKTGGNPFFVTHVVALLDVSKDRQEAPIDLRVPESVRLAIRRQLATLTSNCRDTLSLAAVIGHELDPELLAKAGARQPPSVLEDLEEAARRGLVRESPGNRSRYEFVHALVRETLYEDLTPQERSRRHRAVGDALESLVGIDSPEHVAEIAHHLFEAWSMGDASRAADACARAGQRALAALGYEQAIRHFERAVKAHGAGGGENDGRLWEILTALGRALFRAGRFDTAKASLMRAAAVARTLEDPEKLARAAAEFPMPYGGVSMHLVADHELIDLLEESLSGLGRENTLLRARLLARLGAELLFLPLRERRVALAREALEIARQCGDVPSLTAGMVAMGHECLTPDALSEHRRLIHEVIERGKRTQTKESSIVGYFHLLRNGILVGDPQQVEESARALDDLAETLRQPRFIWLKLTNATMRALLAGRFVDAESHAEAALKIGEAANEPSAAIAYGLQSYFLRMEQGRFAEVEPVAIGMADSLPAIPGLRAMRAAYYAQTGRADEAAWELERAAGDAFREFPSDGVWLAAMLFFAEASAFLGDRASARMLYDLLLPYAPTNGVIGPALVWYGPVARRLGQLAATLGDDVSGERHFRAAEEMELRMGARPALARSQLAHAASLLERGGAENVERAVGLLKRAHRAAAALGMAAVADKAARLGQRASALASRSDRPPSMPTYTIRNEGEYWAVGLVGETFRLKSTKGLEYISRLVSHPGREFHVIELASDGEQPGSSGDASLSIRSAAAAFGDAGDLLDPRAREEYRARLQELREELAEADSFHDVERAAGLRKQIEFLTAELSSALGLGGRERRTSSVVERVRLNVTRAVSSAIKRIAERNPTLGEHLRGAIRTGAFCCYEPKAGKSISWDLG